MAQKKERRTKYSKREVLTLKKVYEEMDKDRNGSVCINELQAAFRCEDKPVFHGKLEDAFRILGVNKDGRICFDELITVCYPLATPGEHETMVNWAYPKRNRQVQFPDTPADILEELRSIFILYDKNKNGVLDKQELFAATAQCGYDPVEVEELFKQADKDGSNSLCVDEFVDMMGQAYV
eukprot:jgi/Chrzof1/8409/Cz03g09170.t1